MQCFYLKILLMLHEYCLFFDSIKITQIKEGVNSDPSFYCWHVAEKQPKRLQFIIYKSYFTKLVLVCAADTSEPSVDEVTPVLCGALWVWALQCRVPRRDQAAPDDPFVHSPHQWSIPLLPAGSSCQNGCSGSKPQQQRKKRLHFHVTSTKQNKIKEIECKNLTLKEY